MPGHGFGVPREDRVAPPVGDVDISVSLVSGKSVTLKVPSNAKAAWVKEHASEKLGLAGEELELVLGEDPVPDDWHASQLSGKALVKLVVLSSGSIAFANRFRIAVVSGSTLKEDLCIDLGQTKRRSPYLVSWNPCHITQLAVKAKNFAWILDVSSGEECWSRSFQLIPGLENSHFQWTSDGRKLIFIHLREVIICDIASGNEQILKQDSDVLGVSLHPDGVLLAIGRTDVISFFDLDQGTEKESWLTTRPLTRLMWDSSGQFLALAETAGSLRILSSSGELKWLLRQCDAAHQMGMQDSIAGVCWSPAGSDPLIAFSSSMGTSFQVFSAQKGKIAWRSSCVGPVADFAWNYNGLKLACASPRGHIHVFTSEGALLNSLELSGPVTSVSWSAA